MKREILLCTLLVAMAAAMIVVAMIPVGCEKNEEPEAGPVIISGSEGVINGVRWAACNVDRPGTFAPAPDSAGMLYQWSRATGWSVTGPKRAWGVDGEIPKPVWNYNNYLGEEWLPEADPCPTGWRIPTAKETGTLLDGEKVRSEWIEAEDETTLSGRIFTDRATNRTVFFPATGYRLASDGGLFDVGITGYYWSTGPDSPGLLLSRDLYRGYNDHSSNHMDYSFADYGMAVRCVAGDDNEPSVTAPSSL
jgi:uncharacterized protein (TIGR02145 family)